MVVEVDDPTTKYYRLKREQSRIKTYFKDKKLERMMDDNFKSKKKSTGDKIMERLKNDTKLPEEVKQKIQARMLQHANDPDSDSDSDDGSDMSDSDNGNSTTRSGRGSNNKTNTSFESKVSKSDSI